MFRSFASSYMNMRADVYIQKNVQTDSGHISRAWVYHKTLWCKAEAVSTMKATKLINQSVEGFLDQIVVKLKTIEPISHRWRITNVKSNDNQIVFPEMDKIEPESTIFDVRQSHAVVDPFGRISYHETLLKRTVVQENDIYSN